MILTEFKTEHLIKMDSLLTIDTANQMEAIIERGSKREGPKAFTAIHEGLIIGCGGVEMLWDGVGEGWAVPSIHVAKYKRLVIEITIAGLSKIFDEDSKLRRVHSLVLDGFPDGDRLMEILDFTYEGTLRKYGVRGETYKMFAMVRA